MKDNKIYYNTLIALPQIERDVRNSFFGSIFNHKDESPLSPDCTFNLYLV